MKKRRQQKISDYVHSKEQVSITELCSKFGISRATIHRDLATLEQRGDLVRGRGIVRSSALGTATSDHPSFKRFQDRLLRNHEEKVVAAHRAIAQIHDGDILFLDSSTTVYCLARELQRQNFSRLTIITNSVLIIQEFPAFSPQVSLIALGGNYDPHLNAFLGTVTVEALNRLHIDQAFVSAQGITPNGAFSLNEYHAAFLKHVISTTPKTHLLVTEEKFDRCGLFRIAPLSHFTDIISSASSLPAYCRPAPSPMQIETPTT